MTSIDSTNDQNTCLELFKAAFIHQLSKYASRKNWKLSYLDCYTGNICETLRVET